MEFEYALLLDDSKESVHFVSVIMKLQLCREILLFFEVSKKKDEARKTKVNY